MIDTILTIGSLAGMLYGLYQFLIRHNIGRKQLAIYVSILKSGASSTYDFFKYVAVSILFAITRVFYSVFVLAWRIYMTITVPAICIALNLQNSKQAEKAYDKRLLNELDSYFQAHFTVLENLPEFAGWIPFFAIILFLGWMINFDNIFTALEKRAEEFLEELKKLSTTYRESGNNKSSS